DHPDALGEVGGELRELVRAEDDDGGDEDDQDLAPADVVEHRSSSMRTRPRRFRTSASPATDSRQLYDSHRPGRVVGPTDGQVSSSSSPRVTFVVLRCPSRSYTTVQVSFGACERTAAIMSLAVWIGWSLN